VTIVLDSWAVLRYLDGAEPAATLVEHLLAEQRPLMSWINLGEVYYVVRRAHGEGAADETIRDLRGVVDTQLPDVSLVLDAARIKADHPMAYADAFGAALAVAERAELWTGDPELLVDGAMWRWRDLRTPS
jgi:predicted nucleic acid-binding protein